jgi:hypothetical protein
MLMSHGATYTCYFADRKFCGKSTMLWVTDTYIQYIVLVSTGRQESWHQKGHSKVHSHGIIIINLVSLTSLTGVKIKMLPGTNKDIMCSALILNKVLHANIHTNDELLICLCQCKMCRICVLQLVLTIVYDSQLESTNR